MKFAASSGHATAGWDRNAQFNRLTLNFFSKDLEDEFRRDYVRKSLCARVHPIGATAAAK